MRKTAIKKTVQSCPEPDLRLAGLVKYWSLGSAGKALFRATIVPDEHMEIIFDFIPSGGKMAAYLMGVQSKPLVWSTKKPVDLVGCRLLPGSFYSLFRISANRFLGKKVPLSSAIGPKSACFDQVLTKKTLKEKMKCLDSILLNFAKTKEPMPPAIVRALKDIRACNGRIEVSTLAGILGLTRFRFTKLFTRWVGVSPQLFCKHACFTEALNDLHAGKSVKDVVAKFGYSDQSHFINVFKRRMGWSPMKRFKQGRSLKSI